MEAQSYDHQNIRGSRNSEPKPVDPIMATWNGPFQSYDRAKGP
jgi:hypothetical protein